MEDREKPTVVKANALVQAGYRLSLGEQRVLLSAITQIRRDEEPTDQQLYSVDANALMDLTGRSAQQAYRELADAAERLYRREVRIVGGPNGSMEGPDGTRVTMTRWVQQVDYIRNEGRVELRFSTAILPYLTMLKKEFTKYKIRHIAGMRSTHGVRLYELLQQWRQEGEREIELEEFKRMFGVEGRYPSIKDLKKYVLEPAIRDVNDRSDIAVQWGQRKAGRKVVAFQFRFWQKPQGGGQDKPKGPKRKHVTQQELEKIAHKAKRGEDWESFRRRVQENPELLGEG